MSDERYAEAIAMYRTGVSLRECVKRLGLPIRAQSLRLHLVTRGFQLRDRATANRGTDTRSRRTINVHGYILVRINGRRRLEHRVVMEAIIGRPLRGDEVVHHLNHDKADNRPENLSLTEPSRHNREHAVERWSDPVWKARTVASMKAKGFPGGFKPGHKNTHRT